MYANDFQKVFGDGKPVLGMLHLNGTTDHNRVATALKEAQIMDSAGMDGVIVENYFGATRHVETVLAELAGLDLTCKIGINVLGDTHTAFALAARYDVDFIQVDSVCGHLPPAQDAIFARELQAMRENSNVLLLGGVRFKYTQVLSGRSEFDDLQIGSNRCDAIVVTSDATGQQTDIAKITRFRDTLFADKPLIVGAGLTPFNVREQFAVADGGIVGSWLKDNHKDTGVLSPAHVEAFLRAARLPDPNQGNQFQIV